VKSERTTIEEYNMNATTAGLLGAIIEAFVIENNGK